MGLDFGWMPCFHPLPTMKSRPDCIICALQQALNTARRVTDDPVVHHDVLGRVAKILSTTSLDQTPAELSQPAYAAVAAVTGIVDPYATEKGETNIVALELLPHVEAMIEEAEDPLDAALHAAVAGNVIDLGIGHSFDIARDITDIMHKPFAVCAIDDFRAEVTPGCKVLYLGDNAGEIVFDTLLVKEILKMGAEVTFTV